MTVELVAGYVAAYNRLRILTGAQIGSLWDRFGGLDDRTLAQFTNAAVATMHAAETATARLTAGYLATVRRETLGDVRLPQLEIRDLIGVNLRGVDPAEVFARPTITARTAIAEGKPFLDAMRAGRVRATELAQTNVMLTQRATVSAMPADRRVVGYRRVLTGSSCVLCATASTQRYHTGQLHPIHSHCDCGVAEIFGDSDPGQVINGKLLEQLKIQARDGQQSLSAAVTSAESNLQVTERRLAEIRDALKTETDSGRRARLVDRQTHYTDRRTAELAALKEQQSQLAAFKKRRVPPDVAEIHHHGELGPVLTFEGDHFTSEAEALH